MRTIRLFLVLALASLGTAIARARANSELTTDKEVTVFHKNIGLGRELVFVRGPRLPSAGTAVLVKDLPRTELDDIFPVRLELRLASGITTPLASRLVLENGERFQILDVLFETERVVVASAEDGDIVLWQVTPVAPVPVRVRFLRDADWTGHQAWSGLKPGAVSAVLSLTKDGLVEVTVKDFRPETRTVTRLLQDGNNWNFHLVDSTKLAPEDRFRSPLDSPTLRAEYTGINISTPNGWLLTIRRDGGGSIGRGGFGPGSRFAERTFNCEKVLNQVRARISMEDGSLKDSVIALIDAPDRWAHPMTDTAIVLRWFKQAHDASPPNGNVERLWLKDPPSTRPAN